MSTARLVSLRDYGVVREFSNVSLEDAGSIVHMALSSMYAFSVSESFMHNGEWVTVYVNDGDYFAISASSGFGVTELEAFKTRHQEALADQT